MASTNSSRRSVFLGPLEISGYYANLERGLRELEVPARLITLFPTTFGYSQGTPNPWPAAWAQRVVLRHRQASVVARPAFGAVFVLASLVLLIWTLPRFDTYVFSWGMTLLPRGADLPLLRLLRKRVIVVVGHGSEARPPFMSTLPAGGSVSDPATLARVTRDTRVVAARLRRIERWATQVVGLATTGQFLRSSFVDFYALGIPTAPAAPSADRPSKAGVTVVHVPSKPEVKGTSHIRACMDAIVLRHPQVRYVEITGRPHAEVLDALAAADLVVDQLWSDIPMAVVGTEAAAMGTPTVIGGYAWDYWRRVLPAEAWPPAICCDPAALEAAIESCLSDLRATARLGEQARDFVVNRWSCRHVAERYLRLFDDDADPEWMIDPAQIDYPFGCGIDRGAVIDVVRGVVARSGWDALAWPRAREIYGELAA